MGYLGDNVYNTLEAIRTALVEVIDGHGIDQPCLVASMPGEAVALDYCDRCTNGMAWVRLVTVARLDDVTGGTTLATCASGFTAILELGWMRGGPTIDLDDTGSVIEVPSEEELNLATMKQMSDMQMMLEALCAARLPTGWKAQATGYTPFGPQGSCYGGLWAVSVPVE